eukprot:13913686-Ditylum_brightwellii.AAC.1
MEAFEDTYILSLKNTHKGYVHLITLQVLNHLFNTYGCIMPVKLEEIDKSMKKGFDPTFPIEHLVEQIETTVTIA